MHTLMLNRGKLVDIMTSSQSKVQNRILQWERKSNPRSISEEEDVSIECESNDEVVLRKHIGKETEILNGHEMSDEVFSPNAKRKSDNENAKRKSDKENAKLKSVKEKQDQRTSNNYTLAKIYSSTKVFDEPRSNEHVRNNLGQSLETEKQDSDGKSPSEDSMSPPQVDNKTPIADRRLEAITNATDFASLKEAVLEVMSEAFKEMDELRDNPSNAPPAPAPPPPPPPLPPPLTPNKLVICKSGSVLSKTETAPGEPDGSTLMMREIQKRLNERNKRESLMTKYRVLAEMDSNKESTNEDEESLA